MVLMSILVIIKLKRGKVKEVMHMRFLKEEKGQGAIEYILLAGGIIVAAVVIFAIYSSMVSSAATSLNETTGTAVGRMGNSIGAQTI
jgi:Flp pilus assembly pilin Flp